MIQPKSVPKPPTPKMGRLHRPVQLCPNRNHCYKCNTALSNHVNWHCKLLNDPDNYVAEIFFAESGHRFCITCRSIVCPNQRTHQNHLFTDSMTFPGPLMRGKHPDQTVTSLTDGDMPSFEEFFKNARYTTRHIPPSCRVKFPKRYLMFVTQF